MNLTDRIKNWETAVANAEDFTYTFHTTIDFLLCIGCFVFLLYICC